MKLQHSLLLLPLAFALQACSSSEVVRAPVEATVGQQLIELKTAHQNGAMNQREYDTQRRRLIDSVK
jgi:hypothetical protein